MRWTWLVLALAALLALGGCAKEENEIVGSPIAGAGGEVEPGPEPDLPEVEEGDVAPDFSAETDSGETITLSEFRGQPVVLYFYPKDDTPGCTKQACSFRDINTELEQEGAVVLGVSLDDVESHRAFKEKYELNFPLVADPSGSIATLYGVLDEYQPAEGEAIPIARRTTFLIDEQGRVAEVWREVDVTRHADEVLEELRTL
jgi:peroxiredoxin Q/BCP